MTYNTKRKEELNNWSQRELNNFLIKFIYDLVVGDFDETRWKDLELLKNIIDDAERRESPTL